MKAHDLARALLAGPDLPVVIAKGEMGDRAEVLETISNWPYPSVEASDGHDFWEDVEGGFRYDQALELQ